MLRYRNLENQIQKLKKRNYFKNSTEQKSNTEEKTMLTYHMDNRGGLSKYEYLYRQIKADIQNGTIKAGEKLPSKRSIAEHLGISVITVESAYGQLLDEGYIFTKDRSGFYVNRHIVSMKYKDILPCEILDAAVKVAGAKACREGDHR